MQLVARLLAPAEQPDANQVYQRAMERGLPPVCEPGHHAFGVTRGTYRGVEVASATLCRRCERTPAQVLAASPAERERYQAWLRTRPPRT